MASDFAFITATALSDLLLSMFILFSASAIVFAIATVFSSVLADISSFLLAEDSATFTSFSLRFSAIETSFLDELSAELTAASAPLFFASTTIVCACCVALATLFSLLAMSVFDFNTFAAEASTLLESTLTAIGELALDSAFSISMISLSRP